MQFKFHGRDEVLPIIEHSGELVEFLTNQSIGCPIDKNTNITFNRILGKGKYAPVWSVSIKGMGDKEYAVKVFIPELLHIKSPIRGALDEVVRKIIKDHKLDIPIKTMIAVNGGNKKRYILLDTIIYIPENALRCKTESKIVYYRFDNPDETFSIPIGSYLCDSEMYSEYVIGVLCANLYRGMSNSNYNINSIHFIDMFGFTTCFEQGSTAYGTHSSMKQYIFMRKISGTLREFEDTFKDPVEGTSYNYFDVLYVQIMFALIAMQYSYQIQHNDLHDENMFFEKITSDTLYNGEYLSKAKYLSYHLFGKTYYIPNTGYVLKIGDFGFSVKYSKPLVGPKEIFETGYDQEDGEGPNIPNWWSTSFDSIYATDYFSEVSSLASNVYDYMETKSGHDNLTNPNTNLPYLKLLTETDAIASPMALFEAGMFDEFLTKENGYVVEIGRVARR